MLNSYKERHPALRRYHDEGGDDRASLVSKHMSTLLVILNKQLLRHDYLQASHTVESITTAMDQVPDVVRKAGIEVLLHDKEAYSECLQLYKQLFTKQRKRRVELLIEMTTYIAVHGNIEEAYDTFQSQVSVEPYKSSPLVQGYCGMLQYILWKRALQRMNTSLGLEDELVSDNQIESKSSLKTQSFCKQALLHFENLRHLEISEGTCVNAFIIVHYKILMTLGKESDGLKLLLEQEEKQPRWICLKRYICQHLEKYCHHKISKRLFYLKKLVDAEESCSEVLEYVGLLLNKDPCDYAEIFKVLVRYLDYPCNAVNDEAWSYLHLVQDNWRGCDKTELLKSRMEWWSQLYPNRISILT